MIAYTMTCPDIRWQDWQSRFLIRATRPLRRDCEKHWIDVPISRAEILPVHAIG